LEFPRKDCLETKAFKKMNKLRLLRLARVKLEGDFKYLSGDLRWLYWHGFPLTCIPAEFQQGSLVAIELKYSKLKQIWKKSQVFVHERITFKFKFIDPKVQLIYKYHLTISRTKRFKSYIFKNYISAPKFNIQS
jgi:hypothetical protein